ncbi:MAG: hypothetical protein ACRDBF_08750, partial [Plesiomonas shigelloides]
AKDMNWENVLILEDDVQFVKQHQTIDNVNNYFNALQNINWDVAFLSANIFEYSSLPKCKNILKIHKSFAACAYIVNKKYYQTLIDNYEDSLSLLTKTGRKDLHALDSHWHSLMKRDTWISIHPNFGYQGADFSEIEQQSVDYTSLFFKDIKDRHTINSIAFYIENSFHYILYKSTIESLLAKGKSCTILVNDLMEASLQNEVIDFLATEKINDHLNIDLLSRIIREKVQFMCLASPYYIELLNEISDINVRYIYGQEKWGHDWWNVFYDKIFCPDGNAKEKLNIFDSCEVIGNTKYVEFLTGEINQEKTKDIANRHCATLKDGKSGYRAAISIIYLIENKNKICENHFRLSLKNKIFNIHTNGAA